MTQTTETMRCTAFAGARVIGAGSLGEVVGATWRYLNEGGTEPLLIFDDETSDIVEVDLRGSLDEALGRLPTDTPESLQRRAGPGRPKLGVVSREISLLPRHWDWLASQPGGASVALRKLVEVARKENAGKDNARRCRDAAHRFMWAMAGDLEGFEEASRSFFAADYAAFNQIVAAWPADVREHARRLVARLVAAESVSQTPPEPGQE
jgi:uncharacterized protein